MASSKTTAKKTATKASPKSGEQSAEPASVARRKAPIATRRVPVQYTPRIPTARCPGC